MGKASDQGIKLGQSFSTETNNLFTAFWPSLQTDSSQTHNCFMFQIWAEMIRWLTCLQQTPSMCPMVLVRNPLADVPVKGKLFTDNCVASQTRSFANSFRSSFFKFLHGILASMLFVYRWINVRGGWEDGWALRSCWKTDPRQLVSHPPVFCCWTDRTVSHCCTTVSVHVLYKHVLWWHILLVKH